jgi:hypothetical protein
VVTLGVLRRAAFSFQKLVVLLGLAVGFPVCLSACAASPESEGRGPEDELEAALNPTGLAQALVKGGGGEYRATTTEEITPPPDKAGGQPVGSTTKTTLYMDRIGHYRLVESNDLDGGREVVLHTSPTLGRQLAVALRYGKLVRRPAHEPEPTRILEEALGGPWMTWEIARRFADIKRQEDPTSTPPTVVFTLSKAAVPRSVRGGFESSSPLRKWRETISLQALRGEVRLEKATGILTAARIEARFNLRREGTPLSGLVRVEATLRDRGKGPAISPPPAEELPVRQRTILEERALLGRPENAGRGRVAP